MAEEIVVDYEAMPENLKNDPVGKVKWEATERARMNAEESASAVKADDNVKDDNKNDDTPSPATKFEITHDDIKDFGDFKTVDEIKEALKERSLTKAERDTLKTELEQMKVELGKKPKTTFKDKDLYRLDKLKAEKPENFEAILKLKYGNPAAIDVLRAKFIKENPEYVGKEAMADKLIYKDFGVDPKKVIDEDTEPEEREEHEIAIARMELKAKATKTELLSELDSIEVPDTEIIDETKQKELSEKLKGDSRNLWKGFTEELSKGLTKFPIKIPETDDKGNIIKGKFIDFADYVIPKEIASECAGAALEYLSENRLIPTNDDEAKRYAMDAKNIMESEMIKRQFSHIILAAIEKGRLLKDEEWHKIINNPSGGKHKDTKGITDKSNADKVYESAVAKFKK